MITDADFAIVVPMRNEAPNLAYLISTIESACIGRRFEAIVVNDGSDDGTGAALDAAAAQHGWIRPVHHPVTAGQSAAVHSGVMAARAPVICTMDGDGQNPPREIPRLVAALLDAPAPIGLVAGQRVNRRDSLSKRAASRLANALRGRLLGDGIRDTGCGLKAFRRDDFLALPYFDHMHRYLPALFRAAGHDVLLLDVSHAERHAGLSNYTNLQRALVGVTDLLGVMWLVRRRKRVRPQDIRWPDDGWTSRMVRGAQHAGHDLDDSRADGPADVLGALPRAMDHV